MKATKSTPQMIDISLKPIIQREAVAIGKIKLKSETINLIKQGKIEKGDPINTAKISGILAAKNTSIIIPLCHPIPITKVYVSIEVLTNEIVIKTVVKAMARTGVEMEALTAVSAALLTVWDMVKQYEKNEEGQYPTTIIQDIHVLKKTKKS